MLFLSYFFPPKEEEESEKFVFLFHLCFFFFLFFFCLRKQTCWKDLPRHADRRKRQNWWYRNQWSYSSFLFLLLLSSLFFSSFNPALSCLLWPELLGKGKGDWKLQGKRERKKGKKSFESMLVSRPVGCFKADSFLYRDTRYKSYR